ncbi:GntR family transcriptional regulator [Streptomyces uncialis]|nr:GntR family transcriptional regulator [Streptomyces uncialis]MCX4664235.1 GntR family transcriptional regulator [Streptomyces uncialis]
MSATPSDPHRPRAPYMRVRDALAADIASGVYAPGDPIPSESELSQRFRVARETARRAVRELRERGVVYTEWGKGSFVVDPSAKGDGRGDA